MTAPGRALEARWLGTRPYPEMLAVQEELVGLRQAGGIPDTLLLLEHPPTYTLALQPDAPETANAAIAADAAQTG
ncbi:MAG: lipoate--protein ligase B, partial [Solirubrobacterales bacterium]